MTLNFELLRYIDDPKGIDEYYLFHKYCK